jgi:hypothetical protein
MAVYNPPIHILDIFDTLVFQSDTEGLDIAQASNYFLRFPTAQGKETLLDVDVTGVANFTDDIHFTNGTGTATLQLDAPNFEISCGGNLELRPNTNIVDLTGNTLDMDGGKIILNQMETLNNVDLNVVCKGTADIVVETNSVERLRINDTGGMTINAKQNKQLIQELNSGATWSAVNGYYGLSKDAYPAVDPTSSGVQSVSTWNTRTTNSNDWFSVCWAPQLGLFASVSRIGIGNRVMTSPDGITWTTRTSAADLTWTSVCWAPEIPLFVAVAASGTGNRVMTSPDGITWTSRTSAADNAWQSVCWAPQLGIFVAVANTGTGDRVMTSPDGITWTLRTPATDNNWISVCWAAELGIFAAVALSGTGNRVMTSPDGINWTSRTSAANNGWHSVCWSSELGLFVAVALSGIGNRVMTSPDGINWTIRTSPADNQWQGVCWAPELGLFVAVAVTGTGDRVMSSPDGINWTIRTSPADNNWRSVCWAPELGIFAAVAISGTGNRVMTSNLAGRPPTSYNVFNSDFNRVDSAGNWTFNRIQFIGANNAIRIGQSAGATGQGTDAIAIGRLAGQTNQHNNSIIINASGANANSNGVSRFFMTPIRGVALGLGVGTLYYDSATYELQYSTN